LKLEQMFGLATGLGSLPHGSPKDAMELIFTYCRHIPHWPQLPRRSAAEGFVAQYLAPLIKQGIVAIKAGGSPYFNQDDARWEERCLSFYELLLDDSASALEPFAFPPEAAAGFYAFTAGKEYIPDEAVCLKGQLSGPVTVGFQVTDARGTPSFYTPSLREILVKTLTAQARWQAARLKALSLPALLFIDDPGLYNYGSSNAVGLGRPEIQASLQEIIEAVRAEGCFTGVHCCAATDWSLLFELPLDLVSFDAYDYFPSLQVYAEDLECFLERGGALAWGIVPSSEKAWQEDSTSLQRLLEEKMAALAWQGVSEERLRSQYIITPACGTGTLDAGLAERIYRLTSQLAGRL
jgi:hypothetical protein